MKTNLDYVADRNTMFTFASEMFATLKVIYNDLWENVNAFATPKSALMLFDLIDELFSDMQNHKNKSSNSL